MPHDRCTSRHSTVDADRGLVHDEWAEVMMPMPVMSRCFSTPVPDETIARASGNGKREFTWSETPEEDSANLELEVMASVIAELRDTTCTEASVIRPRKYHSQNSRQGQSDAPLKVHFVKMSLGQANMAAMSEASNAPGLIESRMSDGDGEANEGRQLGSCGFNVTMQRSGLLAGSSHQFVGMCHHFTWDGKHCVAAGLGSEHANRCAGHLHIGGTVPNAELCKVIGTQTATCAKMDNGLMEVVCVTPSRKTRLVLACSESTCPFLAEGKSCPFSSVLPRRSDTIHL